MRELHASPAASEGRNPAKAVKIELVRFMLKWGITGGNPVLGSEQRLSK
jgi:hypothetical protein